MKTSSRDDVRAMYEDSADGYAEMMDAEIDLPIYDDTLGRLARRITGITGPVVDTSCGSGHMLERYRERHDPGRALLGVDLSSAMVALTAERLEDGADVHAGDMRELPFVEPATAAAVISFYALHHIDPEEAVPTLTEWFRILRTGGQLLLATWEGHGAIDYGDAADLVALRYTTDEVRRWAEEAGFRVDHCAVEPVDDFPMDAVYLEATRLR